MKAVLEEILNRLRKTFEKLFTLYSGQVYSLARYKGLSEQDSQDVVQDTFSAIFSGYDSFQNKASIKTYIISIARNKIFDFYRKKYKKDEVTLEENIESDQTEENIIEKTDLSRQKSKLSENQNLLIHMIFTQGLNYDEAAAVLNIPVGTVKSRMHKIRRLMKEGLGEDYR